MLSDTDPGRPEDETERRGPRRRVLLTGLVAHLDLGVSFRCTIRDRSASGARLKLPDGIVVPTDFWLIDVAEGLAYAAKTIWRRYPEIGVSLADPIDLKKRLDDELTQRRLRALWIEVAPRR
jgi:hypothetical protein